MTDIKDFNELMRENIIKVELSLDKYLESHYPQKIWEAMRYSALSGGKRLRPVLVIEACRACGGSEEIAMPTACALEMVHAYSLIHDDLPCMDNDDFRRGKPTNHKVYGEAMAVLAGDSLLSYAPYVILNNTTQSVDKNVLFNILKEFFESIGPNGLVAGQVVDMETEFKSSDTATLEYIHTHKTGKLFTFAVRAGAMLAGADKDKLDALTYYGKHIGYAFQIADDILDIIGTKESLGKTPGKDTKLNKTTYTSIFGVNESRLEVKKLCELSISKLEELNILTPVLKGIAEGIWLKVSE